MGDRNITTQNLNIATQNRNIDAYVYLGLSVGRMLDPCLCLSRSIVSDQTMDRSKKKKHLLFPTGWSVDASVYLGL